MASPPLLLSCGLALLTFVWNHICAGGEIIKGMCYAPVPLKDTTYLPGDDFMSDGAKPLWGPRGRGDLQLMRDMGVNTVRLYGNDPAKSHRDFLDESLSLGMGVIPGLSDWPYTQMPGNCMSFSNYNCYAQVKESYLGNLQNGWLLPDKTYHPALKQVVAMNEPELKMPRVSEPKKWIRALVSAIDGMLAAEEEMNVQGPLLNFTVTFSFAVCYECVDEGNAYFKPGIRQMLEMRRGLLNPQSYGYTPEHDLTEFLNTRFTNSFNTQNPSTQLRDLFFDEYEILFPDVPVFIGEFHAPHTGYVDQFDDLKNMVAVCDASDLILGFAFFEFQVRYDKGGSEMGFGMFGLGSYSSDTFTFFGIEMETWCLTKVSTDESTLSLPDCLTVAFGGTYQDSSTWCLVDPSKVSLDLEGFDQVYALNSLDAGVTYTTRFILHAGGEVVDPGGLRIFASTVNTLDQLVEVIETGAQRAQLSWAQFDDLAECYADPEGNTAELGLAIEEACAQTWFNCANIPAECRLDDRSTANYVLSVNYVERGTNPLTHCYFDGAAKMITREALATAAPGTATCVVTREAATTMLTEEGYHAVLRRNSTVETESLLMRIIRERLGSILSDSSFIGDLVASMPGSMFETIMLLNESDWLCRGDSESCRPDPVEEPLTQATLQSLLAFGDNSLVTTFAERVVTHLGGQVRNNEAFNSFAQTVESMPGLISALSQSPSWATWDVSQACVLDRGAGNATVGLTIEYACLKTWFDCANLPAECTRDPMDVADYVLSTYRMEREGDVLPTCLFSGSLIFSQTEGDGPCVVSKDPETTPLTDEGFQAILRQDDADLMAVFFKRVIDAKLNAMIIDERQLQTFAESPPVSMYDVLQLLGSAQWLCFEDCIFDGTKSPLTDAGISRVYSQQDTDAMARYVERLVTFLGGRVVQRSELKDFATDIVRQSVEDLALEAIVEDLQRRPDWAAWESDLACVLDEDSVDASVGLTLEYACLNAWFDCSKIPPQCTGDPWDSANYVLSVFASELRSEGRLPTCYFQGELIFAHATASALAQSSPCIVTSDPFTTPLTDEGFQAVMRRNDSEATAAFVYRFAEEYLNATLMNEQGLLSFATVIWTNSLYDLEAVLRGAAWACFPNATSGDDCEPSADTVQLTQAGFDKVYQQSNSTTMVNFFLRVIKHYGGGAVEMDALEAIVASATSLQDLVDAVDLQPSWALWDEELECAAGEYTSVFSSSAAALSIEYACNNTVAFNCGRIPRDCLGSIWDTADYALSVYALEHDWEPLPTCFYRNSLIFAQPRVNGSSGCIVSEDPSTTPLTDEGYQAILLTNDTAKVLIFIQRVVEERLFGEVKSEALLLELAKNPPSQSLFDLESALLQADWVETCTTDEASVICGRGGKYSKLQAEKRTMQSPGDVLAWRTWAFAAVGGVVGLSLLGTLVYVGLCQGRARRLPKAPAQGGETSEINYSV